MRLNRTGAGIIAVFLVAGIALSLVPVLPVRIVGVLYLLGTVVACLIVARAELRAHHNRWLARNGIRGKATVVAASTEISVNEQPLFELVLDLELPGLKPRRIERSIIVGGFAARRMEPGTVLPVYVHPRRPDDLLIVW